MIDNYAESSRFNSIEKYKLQALAIDQLGRGSTAALKILKKWVNVWLPRPDEMAQLWMCIRHIHNLDLKKN